MKVLIFLTLSGILLGALSSASQVADDNRRAVADLDYYQDKKQIDQARAVLAQIPKWRLSFEDSEGIYLWTKNLMTGMDVCADEKFAELPLVSSCSAFLVGADLLLTAGHCLGDELDCSKSYWVLDYDQVLNFSGPSGWVSFKREKVVNCLKVISLSLGASSSSNLSSKKDFALIQIDRKITDRTPLKLRRKGVVSDSDSLTVIGHPMGLPKVLAQGGKIINNSLPHILLTNTDSFSGNSGSPVINERTQKVEGLFIRGGADFKIDLENSCNRPFHCTGEGCFGESVLRSTSFPLEKIPRI